MTDPFARLGLLMVRFRWIVIGIWLVIFVVAGGLLAPRASTVLRAGGYVLPDSESDRADTILQEEFNASTASNVVVIFRSETQTIDDQQYQDEVQTSLDLLAGVEDVESIVSFFNTLDPSLVSEDRRSTVAIVSLSGAEEHVQELVPELREVLEDVPLETFITGSPAINHDLEVVSEDDLRRAELFTIPIVIVLLLIVFRTLVAAMIPLILGACTVVTAVSIIYIIGTQTDTSIFALNVASMIGLGLGIDFSLIVVSRFRDEMKRGRSVEDSIAWTMATAGRSITFSGVTVILGMVVLTVLFGLMVVRSISLGVMLSATTALLSGLTLLPALLAVLGNRIERLRVIPNFKTREASGPGIWYRISHAIMRRPWVWLGVSTLILLGIAIPAKDIALYSTTSRVMPSSVESAAGVDALADAFGGNRLTPIQIVIQADDPDGVWDPEFLTGLDELSTTVEADDTVEEVISLRTLTGGVSSEQFRLLNERFFESDPQRAAAAAQVVNLDGNNDAAVITIFSKFEQYDDEHEEFVQDLRNNIIPNVDELSEFDVSVGGDSARALDYRNFLYGRFPYLIAAVMVLTFVILMMFFQSVLLPLKAILMNLASILATYGALVLIFQEGFGADLLGFDPIGRLSVFTPAVLFAILFGLSTDYEVFMLSRVKEYYHQTGDNEESVATGLEHTAGIITAAGLILIGTFGSFGIADVVVIKEIGIGLAIGVLIDSTIVRVIMVPATMRLMGNVNWWMPDWLRKIVPEVREGPSESPMPAPLPSPVPALAYAPASMPQISNQQPDLAAAPVQPVARPAAAIVEKPRPIMFGQLRSIGGSVGADVIVLPRSQPFRVGRDEASDLQLFDVRISRRHAEINFIGGVYEVKDLGSTNGVTVNGVRITHPVPLQHGDRIEMGNMGTVIFMFEMINAAERAASASSGT